MCDVWLQIPVYWSNWDAVHDNSCKSKKGRDYLKVLSVSQVWLISAATNEDNTSHKQAVTFEDICHITLKCEIRQSWKEIHTLHNI